MKTTSIQYAFIPALAGLLAVLPGSASGQGGDLAYSSGSTGADGALRIPEPMASRQGDSGAFDVARGEIVLFGGRSTSNGSVYFGDTWVRSTGRWVAKTPATAPAGRTDHAMAYDPVKQEVILFGGTNAASNYLSDMWKWDGTTWTLLAPATKPTARYGAAMTYDATRQRMVLFGGVDSTGTLNDTWLWNGTTWTKSAPASSPPARYQGGMTFNSATQLAVLFGGQNSSNQGLADTWIWNGTAWSQIVSAGTPPSGISRLVYDTNSQDLLLFTASSTSTWIFTAGGWNALGNGSLPGSASNYGMAVYDPVRQVTVLNAQGTTAVWNGGAWSGELDRNYQFDMTARASVIWNFTQIVIPSTVAVYFKKNAANTPVTWLASGHVIIDGTINLDGVAGMAGGPGSVGGAGGPGGFAGGNGGTYNGDLPPPYNGQPGDGPGGGAGGDSAVNLAGGTGAYRASYGNAYLQPLIGGSGGGGSAHYGGPSSYSDGGSGGGGGGAILLASSRDITISGSISAGGGSGGASNFYSGGAGSGGAIRLVADRVSGAGSINVGGSGRVRLEALQHTFTGSSSVQLVKAPPTGELVNPNGRLVVSQVAGTNVAQPPSGDTANPDVVFNSAGAITVTVTATNIANGTPVKLRITAAGQTINLPAAGQPAVTLAGGTASFSTIVPAGRGTIQASASFTVTAP